MLPIYASLLNECWCAGYGKIGSLVMLLHDVSDIPLDLLRIVMALKWNSLQVLRRCCCCSANSQLIYMLSFFSDTVLPGHASVLVVLEVVDSAKCGVANDPARQQELFVSL